ncbi:glycosyltransferase family 4 protein [Novosphingobium resinovorum]|uniref:glycosyltransferase family 4 protein n=1 Tax=Novosphingobium TaxID=165696 RepID=UPI001B3C92BC|nr:MULTISPECIES: glycosyltransferase family 4 protein [Novosphingobium]MBF7010233.1 glycosyltransferase family 4 protein [Novosphingobium sp. HR1a]WJM28244.1 glycosyltransferase family 4 protein [Novosphingobium resinovorum]
MIDRIVQINDLSDPKGGASKLAVEAACGLAARGHPVTFITGDEGHSPALTAAGVDIVALGQQRLKASGRFSALANGLWNRAAHAMVSAWIAAHDTPQTVYHLHGWAQILSPAVFGALTPVRDRLVISAHDFFLACPNGAFAWLKSGNVCPHTPLSQACLITPCDRDGAAHKAWRSVRQAIHRKAFHPRSSPPVLAIHESMREFLSRGGIPDHAIVTLPNPAVPFSQSRIPAERNREVLFVGRLEDSKGVDLAARAAAMAGAPLSVVGEGPFADRVTDLYPASRMLGRRSPPEIREIAARARMLVMPSRYPEPFGLVAIEAAWSGLPVILAETALLAPDIIGCGAGLAIDPRDTPRFAAAILQLSEDDTAIRAMSEAAYAATRPLALTPQTWIDRIEGILHQRIAPSPIEDQVITATIPAHSARLSAPASSHHFQTMGLPPAGTGRDRAFDEADGGLATACSSLGSSPAMISSSCHATS